MKYLFCLTFLSSCSYIKKKDEETRKENATVLHDFKDVAYHRYCFKNLIVVNARESFFYELNEYGKPVSCK